MPTFKVFSYQVLHAGLIACYVAIPLAWVWVYKELRAGRSILPPVTPRRVPWGPVSIGLVLLTWFSTRFLAGDIYVTLSGRQRTDHIPLSFVEQICVGSIWNGLVLVTVPMLLMLTSRAGFRDLGLERRGLIWHSAQGVVAFLLVCVPIYSVNYLSVSLFKLLIRGEDPNQHPIQKMVQENLSGEVAFLAVLSAVILAPAAEELLFRVVIQSWLYKVFDELCGQDLRSPAPELPAIPTSSDPSSDVDFSVTPVTEASERDPSPQPGGANGVDDGQSQIAGWFAIVSTSLLFALAHWEQWPAPIAIFFLSLALGAVFHRSGSFWSSFFLHALFNGLSTIILFWTILGAESNVKKETPPPAPPAIKAESRFDGSKCGVLRA